ncbi:hypothetical protein HNQ77_002977 [Silvibacterium bohemicum]|uniref:Flagella basal body P-ring formation protein FlgA SAF domain-containing protein n=1 Tax=Silvibacterium bohemicum TaxID=1577686 RepID=A0A841K1G1_9BACT|nr:flagella basal body P-ring formation protein FlgA [Silvibacterium bohemicum]MBB6145021.1 hypothetical protein [Silvibacterium bohemicum]
MTIRNSISALVLSAALTLPAGAAAGREVITAEQVAATMTNAGMQVSAKQVELLTDVVATTATPTLKIRSMEPWGDHRMMVRLDCARSEECVPFFVAVRFNPIGQAQPVSSDSAHLLPAAATVPMTAPARSIATAAPAVRAGSIVTLLLDGPRVHIKLPVVSLENGTIGQTIRVATKDHRLTYVAEVVDGTLLRGSL